MNCKLVLIFGLAIFISQLHDLEAAATRLGGKNCRCSSTLVWDTDTQQNIGKCKTQFGDKYWCYVNRATCSDAVESRKRPGLYYSYLACPNNPKPQPQPFRPVEYDDDYYPEY